MIRQMIQLTDSQAARLRRRAKEEGVSVAELVRRGVDILLDTPADDVRERARACVGIVEGPADLSERHTEYAAEALEEK